MILLSMSLLLIHWLYSKECCDDSHCHPVPCEEIISKGDGWEWHGKDFAKYMLKISPNGECHVCVSAAPICIYLPPRV
jgi:hypothetical protein